MADQLTAVRAPDCLSTFLKDIEDLELNCLPGVEHFEMPDFVECCPSDDDMQALTQLLPNLKCMRIAAPITGRHVARFVRLEELCVYDDQEKKYEVSKEHLEEICVQLQQLRVLDVRCYDSSKLQLTHIDRCLQLEELRLNLNSLKPVLRQVLSLPHLRSLTVMLDRLIDISRIVNVDTHDYKIYETTEFFEIIRALGERITGLAVDTYYLPLALDWDAELAVTLRSGKLQQLAWCSCDFGNTETLLRRFAEASPQLQMVCLRNWPLMTNAAVLQFVRMCPQLRHVDVSYCNRLSQHLLHAALAIVQQQKRAQPLSIYVWRCDALEREVEKTNPKFWQMQKELLVCADQLPGGAPGLSYVERGYKFDFSKLN